MNKQPSNTATLYITSDNHWTVYASIDTNPQLIFYWDNLAQKEIQSPKDRVTKRPIGNAHILDLTDSTVTFEINNKKTTLLWILNSSKSNASIARRANVIGKLIQKPLLTADDLRL